MTFCYIYCVFIASINIKICSVSTHAYDARLPDTTELSMSTNPSASSQPTIILTTVDTAPRSLNLRHAICLPCRSAASRCDGHAGYTQACIQCRKRRVDCAWRVVGDTEQRKRQRRTNKEETDSDNEGGSERAETSTQHRQKVHKRSRSRSRSKAVWESENETGKLPVPSAGWPMKSRRRISNLNNNNRIDIKEEEEGKLKSPVGPNTRSENEATSSDSSAEGSENNEDTDSKDVLEDLEYDTSVLDTLISRLSSSARGNRFLTISSYNSLLSSMFAEASSDLSHSLFWWDTSASAKTIRARCPSLLSIEPEEWRNMSYLDRLLAENAYSWTLWPRQIIPKHPTLNLNNSHPPPKLPEEIAALVLHFLSRSNIPEQVATSLSPIHLRVLIEGKHNFDTSFPHHQSTANRKSHTTNSTYAIPYMTETEYRATYLNREAMILEHADQVEGAIILQVKHAIDSVLLKIAEMRLPYGMRRHIPVRYAKGDKGKETQRMDHEQEDTARTSLEDNIPEEKKKAARTKSQVPGDWKSFLHAAICVKKLPRR